MAGSGLEFVCLCLVQGADVGGDFGEKEQSLDVKGTSVFCSDKHGGRRAAVFRNSRVLVRGLDIFKNKRELFKLPFSSPF